MGARQDWWQAGLKPLAFVPARSLGNGVLIEPPNVYTRQDTPFSWNVGTVYRVAPGVSTFFGVTRSNFANFNSEGAGERDEYEAGLKVAALNDHVLMTLAAFLIVRDNVFSRVNDITVFNNQRTEGATEVCSWGLRAVGS